eukprot:SAG11_NODE_30_length_23132_cov_22.413277_12_plen_162_part_00
MPASRCEPCTDSVALTLVDSAAPAFSCMMAWPRVAVDTVHVHVVLENSACSNPSAPLPGVKVSVNRAEGLMLMCLKLRPDVKATKKTELKKDVWIPVWSVMVSARITSRPRWRMHGTRCVRAPHGPRPLCFRISATRPSASTRSGWALRQILRSRCARPTA